MKAKLLNEQMGVPAGTVMEVLNDGGTRARVCIAPNGLRIAVAAECLEMVPDEDPSLLVNIFGAGSQPVEETSEVESAEPEVYDFSRDMVPDAEEEPLADENWAAPLDPPVVTDDDLDEELPTPQGSCDGEACESCT